MKLRQPLSVKALSKIISGTFYGDGDLLITGINEIHRVESGDLVFVDHPKYFTKALDSLASAVLINDSSVEIPKGKAILFSKNPFADFNTLTRHFSPNVNSMKNFGERSSSGKNTFIHPSAVIGNDVHIGDNCTIHANVTLYNQCTVGNNVTIHSNSVIGANAFYYKKNNLTFSSMHSCGRVIIEDHVEIGALSTIDKGVTSNTIIKKGTKMDNQVHIGHDTIVGENCLFAAQVGIAGCVTIEDNVILWGQVGIPSNITIGKGAVVLGQSGVTKNLAPEKTYFGSPAHEARAKFKELASIRKLPKIIEKLSK